MRIMLIFLSMGIILQGYAQTPEKTFRPTLSYKVQVQNRFEASLTDSIDVSGAVAEDPTTTNFRIRRAKFAISAKLNDQWSAKLQLALQEFTNPLGKVLEYAFINYKYREWLQVSLGQNKAPFCGEELRSSSNLFVIDRGPTTDALKENNYSSYQIGLMLHGQVGPNSLPINYSAGVFNANGRNQKVDDDRNKFYEARVEFELRPWLRLAASGALAGLEQDYGYVVGSDLLIEKKISDRWGVLGYAEFAHGPNLDAYLSSTMLQPINDFDFTGYHGTFRLDYYPNKCIETLETGIKYEHFTYLENTPNANIQTITPHIGFVFLPQHSARLRLNAVRTIYDTEIPGSQLNHWLFVAQLQLLLKS